jgi:flagellar basal body L-ring protein FlgH
MKFEIQKFFKTNKATRIADFIVVKLEENQQYYVEESRYETCKKKDIINEEVFVKTLHMSKRPIVLSNIYINVNL